MSSQPLWSRVVAGITRLCEPFQQALAGMPLEKLAPANEEEARQRLLAVVDQELDRIGRFRAEHYSRQLAIFRAMRGLDPL
jgi:hypothetical protein